jgi:hypothetical protein
MIQKLKFWKCLLENKKEYLATLGQIDKFQDYEPFKKIIISSAIESLRKEEKARKNK